MKLAAVYTTYKPDSNFMQRIDPILSSCEITIVVDNTPGANSFFSSNKLHVIQDGVNHGLGKALNLGVLKARELGCNAVVLFDQDSSPSSKFINDMKEGLKDAMIKFGNVCCVGPQHLDDSIEEKSIIRNRFKFLEVSCLATSGMMFLIDDDIQLQRFSESLFLDLVDFDWCWKMRETGIRIIRLQQVIMYHRLGLAQRKFLGFTYHIPAPYRHYFQFRDTLNMLAWRHAPFYAKLRLGLILIPKFIIYPFILDRGLERVMWMIKGVKDFLLNRQGVGAARDRLC